MHSSARGTVNAAALCGATGFCVIVVANKRYLAQVTRLPRHLTFRLVQPPHSTPLPMTCMRATFGKLTANRQTFCAV